MKRGIQIAAGVSLCIFIYTLLAHAMMFAWALFFPVAILGLFALASSPLVAPPAYIHSNHAVAVAPQQQGSFEEGLPWIPRTAHEAHATLSDKEFELFSAAVIIGALGGYTFDRHCGGPGDRGVDVILRNTYGHVVAVQSKRHASDNHISSEMVRTFLGSLSPHDAVYGFFVTTSTFSRDAQPDLQHAGWRIRPIDAPRLDVHLQWRAREIALAWREIQDQLKRAGN
ncbi:MAG TPA: restriction endonuclease [Ktedonobacteraceae bacterium]|nr:restriction endonuclease [Ktedonobacteraceae bacterium]